MAIDNKELKEVFKYLVDNRTKMSISQISLIASFEKYFKKYKALSEKQTDILLNIKNNL
jgi:hypothetical protein